MTLVLPVPIQQISLSDPHGHPLPAMSTSFIISPSPRPSQPCSHHRPQRPKLTINTQQTRTFGKGSSLRLETLSAVSPTSRNTFQNAYETNRVQVASTPLRLSTEVPESPTTPDPADGRTPSSSSISSASTFSDSGAIPYKLSHTTSSILLNSPIPRTERRRFSMTQTRPIFPTEKHVSFRSPLVEEIRTSRYVWKHSDIESEESTPIAVESVSSEVVTIASPSIAEVLSAQEEAEAADDPITTPSDLSQSNSAFNEASLSSPPPSAVRLSYRPGRSRVKLRSPQTGDKRDSSSESDSDSCPETPVAGRRLFKRSRREWQWTLPTFGAMDGEPRSLGDAEARDESWTAGDGSTAGEVSELDQLEQSSNPEEHTDYSSSRSSSEITAESSIASDDLLK